jgi:hypothetical protein
MPKPLALTLALLLAATPFACASADFTVADRAAMDAIDGAPDTDPDASGDPSDAPADTTPDASDAPSGDATDSAPDASGDAFGSESDTPPDASGDSSGPSTDAASDSVARDSASDAIVDTIADSYDPNLPCAHCAWGVGCPVPPNTDAYCWNVCHQSACYWNIELGNITCHCGTP